MKVDEIRPDALLAGQREALKRDIELINSWSRDFVETQCPACGAADNEPVYEKYGMQHRKCSDCRTQYISPRPTPEMLAEFYSVSENYAYWAKHIYPASAEARREKIFKPRARLIDELCRERKLKGGVFLEVGTGYGIFCEELSRLGLFDRIMGLEPSPQLAEICREKGIEIIEKPFEEANIDIQADVVASFEVIEHLFRPSDFVEWIYRALRPGGIAILTCPNIEGFDTLLLGREAVAVDHQHLNYFNPDSLDVLLRQTGFGSVEISTPGMMDVDLVRRGLKNGEVSEQKLGPILNRLLAAENDSLDRQLQALLQEARLSSNMMAVAMK